jgi:polyferredoxin
MKRLVSTAVVVILALGLAHHVQADLIPTPDFSNHAIPTTSVHHPESSWWVLADISALILALVLATYFAHVSRSRNNLLLLTIASLAYFGFVRGGCVCPIGATQNVALAVASPSYVVPITVIVFFTLPMVFTLFFGRTFCAAVCPLGAVQELVSVRSVRVPTWLDQSLRLVSYLYLGTAVILAATNTAFIICRFDPFVAMFRLSGSAPMFLFGGGVLLIGVFVGRPYCRYLCPYGAILRLLSRFSKWHVRIPPASCINCRLCENVCPYDAIQAPTDALPAAEKRAGKSRLVIMLALAPVLIVVGAGLGRFLGVPLASWNADVRLAEELRIEELGLRSETIAATEAFRGAGGSPREAHAVALQWRQRFSRLGTWLGAWVGLVVAAKLIQLSLLHRRSEYQPDRSGCVSCGRCFWYCPVEQVRLGLIHDASDALAEVPR